MFVSSSDRIDAEKIARAALKDKQLVFGIPFLDEATRGISPNDMILLGAPTGMGKTEACVQIALANLAEGKRVHFIALEAEPYEIERRLMFPLIATAFYSDDNHDQINTKLNMTDWVLGRFDKEIEKYESSVATYMKNAFKGLFTFYKAEKFGVDELIYNAMSVCDQTDLIIIDHIHYFDWDDDNDNRAIKNIAKAVRKICLEIGKPVILVAHLRKKDKASKDIVAGPDEFHGSSDLTKIATKIITISSANQIDGNKYATYFRVAKNRLDGSITRFVAQVNFDYKIRRYENEYKLGMVGAAKFEEIAEYPYWSSGGRNVPKRQPTTFTERSLPSDQSEMPIPDQGVGV